MTHSTLLDTFNKRVSINCFGRERNTRKTVCRKGKNRRTFIALIMLVTNNVFLVNSIHLLLLVEEISKPNLIKTNCQKTVN